MKPEAFEKSPYATWPKVQKQALQIAKLSPVGRDKLGVCFTDYDINPPSGSGLSGQGGHDAIDHSEGLNGTFEDLEMGLIQQALRQTLGNRSQVSDLLKTSRLDPLTQNDQTQLH